MVLAAFGGGAAHRLPFGPAAGEAGTDPFGAADGFLVGDPSGDGGEQFGGLVGAVEPGFLVADERDVPFAQLPDQPQEFFDALSAESVDGLDDEDGELAAVRVVEHSLECLAVLALVGGGVGDLVAACDLPAAVLAETLEVRDLVVLVLARG